MTNMALKLQITDLIHQLGGDTWTRMCHLMPKLDADRQDVVDAMVQLQVAGIISMSPDSDTKWLSAADHTHAVRVGGEDLHMVCLQPSW